MGEKRSRGRQLRKEAAPARRAQRAADSILMGFAADLHMRALPRETNRRRG
ncbi:hypothetical protein SEA_PUPPER_10 [Gordonia phage Pupper]|uniref:Uncharacterized protein n=1 Tax=Gordonia phage Pupper TaxID=2571249 RepID=A0A4Y6EKD5_9CAUD|nr:hypothetical protein KHQ83_gp010 [Gordonia phage Pupper]QDF18497.1 hypothetical protein SEA_PUPPER_10 [Gordonia phage Pupper]QDF18730.1 hypothetical protein SEA_SCENTAE_10 [Gordonia phage SCentae]